MPVLTQPFVPHWSLVAGWLLPKVDNRDGMCYLMCTVAEGPLQSVGNLESAAGALAHGTAMMAVIRRLSLTGLVMQVITRGTG
jgi:hypothetical protein